MSGSAKAAPEQATTLATTFLVSVGGALALSASFETAAAVVALAQASSVSYTHLTLPTKA